MPRLHVAIESIRQRNWARATVLVQQRSAAIAERELRNWQSSLEWLKSGGFNPTPAQVAAMEADRDQVIAAAQALDALSCIQRLAEGHGAHVRALQGLSRLTEQAKAVLRAVVKPRPAHQARVRAHGPPTPPKLRSLCELLTSSLTAASAAPPVAPLRG